MYIVKLVNGGVSWYLRNTTWTSDMSRAAQFPTIELAGEARLKAKQFMRASEYKKAEIIKLEDF